jgi:cytochrome c oxidase cbb3-type subunit III
VRTRNGAELHFRGIFDSIADRMRPILFWILSLAVIASRCAVAQESEAQGATQSKTPPRDAKQSPAAQQLPKTIKPQSYSIEQVQAGELRFASQCGFCHGRDAAGGETGPDLTRSPLVAEDNRGDKIATVVRGGRPSRGMPAFNISDADLAAVVAFIHDQKTKAEALGGARRSVDPADLATGDATAGRRYFNGAGGCSACHSPAGDLSGVARRFEGLDLLKRMLYPAGRPAPASPQATVWLPSGETITGPLSSEDEFTIALKNPAGEELRYEKNSVKFEIKDPMSAHFTQLAKYTDQDMHNVYAYLATLK